MINNSLKVASHLLRLKAVFFNVAEPFTWASGIKSPMYCDNRLVLSDVLARNEIEQSLCDLVKAEYPNVDSIVGTATAGIPHAAIIADKLELPMAYVRSGAKEHGRQNLIEGKVQAGDKVVVIEDLISTAGSSIKVAEVLENAGVEVLGIVSIFTYNMKKAQDNLNKMNLNSHSLCSLDIIVEQAVKEGYIKQDDAEKILKFRDNPSDESWIGK